MEDSLQRIEDRLETLAKRERKANGFQLWLWVINAIVLPALAFCMYHVISIISNRYTSSDAAEHQQQHIAHYHEHSRLAERLAKMEAKLAGLPPRQIEENRSSIKELGGRLRQLEQTTIDTRPVNR